MPRSSSGRSRATARRASVSAASVEQGSTPALSAIITFFNEEPVVEEFCRRLIEALEALGRPYEVIAVDDGSRDRTWDQIVRAFTTYPEFSKAIRLVRNAGQLAAMTAGICEAQGDVFLFLDSDLQLDPADLPKLMKKLDQGHDMVTGYRVDRKDPLPRLMASRLANVIGRRASGSAFRDFGCTFKLYDARLVRAFQLGPFRTFSTLAAIAQAANPVEVPVTHHPRPFGQSGWTFQKLWRFNMDNLLNLRYSPFRVIAFLCALSALLLAGGGITGVRILEVSRAAGFAVLACALFANAAVLCLIGEILLRILATLRPKPAYVVREILNKTA